MQSRKSTTKLARDLPREARRLLAEQIDSVGGLDLLMLLSRDRTRALTVDEICEALRCPRGWAEGRLGALTQAGFLVEHEGRYLYAPATSVLDEAVQALEHAHDTRWDELMALIASPRRRRQLHVHEQTRNG